MTVHGGAHRHREHHGADELRGAVAQTQHRDAVRAGSDGGHDRHEGRPQDRDADVDQRRGPGVLVRVRHPGQQQHHGVAGHADGEAGHRSGHLGHVIRGVAQSDHTGDGFGQRHQRTGRRDREQGDGAGRPADLVAEIGPSPGPGESCQVGERGGEHGHGEQRHRQHEQDERQLVDDHAALEGVGQVQHRHQQGLRGAQEPGRPRPLAQQPTEDRMTPAEHRSETEAVTPRRHHRHGAERHDPQEGAHRQDELLGRRQVERRRLIAAHGAEQQVGADDHDVVDRRGEHGLPEVPGRVQDRGGDHRRCVEQHLGQEEPQQEGAQLDLGGPYRGVVDTRHEQLHDPGSGHHRRGHHRGEQGEHRPQHHPGGLLGVPLRSTVDGVDHDRDQHRLQDAGREQLEEDVRDGVGALVRVAQVRGAQHGGHHHDAGEPGEPAHRGEHRHGGGVAVAVRHRGCRRAVAPGVGLRGHDPGTVGNGAVAARPVP